MDCLGNNAVLTCTNSIDYHETNNFFLMWYYHKFNLLRFSEKYKKTNNEISTMTTYFPNSFILII